MTHKTCRGRTGRAALPLLALALAACHKEPVSVHYDLAPDASLAEWVGPDGVRLVLAPASRSAAAFLEGPVAAERRVALDLEVPESSEGARALVRLNDRELLELELRGGRHRYLAPLPQDAQQPGLNRLEVALEAAALGGSGGEPRLELHGLAVAPAEASLPAWLAENDAPPLAVTREKGVPSLLQAGPSTVRFALRLPEDAELRFTPERPRSGSGPARLKVGLTGAGGNEQELWTGQVAAGREAEEVTVPLPGKAGQEVRLALHVEGADGAPGMAAWKAPRVIGRGPRTGLGSAPPQEADLAKGAALREVVAGSSLLLVVLDGVPAGAATPEIDRLAAEGVRFERTYSPATSASAAMASLWTSQYPDRHHRGLPAEAPLPQQALTVADVVAAQGVETAGFVTRPELGAESGLDRGFTTFQVVTEGTVRAAAEWLGGRSGRFFAYLQLGGEADGELAELRQSLETAGVWQKLVVIVTADRGAVGSGPDLSDRALRVPLVVRFPSGKGPAGKRVDTLVDLLEVAPTIADVFGRLGKSGTDREFEGRSLLAVIDGAPGRGVTLLRSDEPEPGYALCDGQMKLVFGLRRGTLALFDLAADPGETNDLAGAQPIRAERYRLALFRWLRDLARAPGEGGTETLSPEELENLKALGYVG